MFALPLYEEKGVVVLKSSSSSQTVHAVREIVMLIQWH